MNGLTIKELNIGDKASFQKTITETDVYLYAGITGDLNPAHINQVEAEKTMFQGRIAHGMLTAGLVSAVLGMQLPGPGSIYLGQELKFVAPVKIGDTIKAEVEVIEKFEDKNRIKLSTICTNQNGVEVLVGVANIMPPK
ncbi:MULTISPECIES: MaoC family dehydratase [Clostridium]|jgi:3-hydroxybutyryl-CoA dehydratase|uniref:Acyl dehydratase n=1 Tax=Clostridium saccharoperbutylacetonicum N1-4(HMT) TaxID=931276 RepID=M1MHR5_9CLOT|nr:MULTISPECIES: MaoC family dehydratase [Clostridium]AGF55853.1 acyl dehydratase [Clostridium saccharoperbutylacetonicum N1-4(HMT)]AQR94603.1 (R)-specific enoyl-CoA hydratase [Clostridium saccharoperbutylacetonicum]NRT63413.1 3-hydroxybutyryl-CoA dehydratase [Clostridium saccharoperbutylacetonicum]NSB26775.1 3-hydroxybutyryl-CoA dehydratase [Clostridium saccharoperbutylacetonicum]NSB30440.1 3-hydroxybutyryl-CoA dehydratase [Clostridium saccharoperbutylacetonicum]